MRTRLRTMVLDGLAGALLGFFVLHPISMVIVGLGPDGTPFPTAHLLGAFARPMGFYFALIGLAAGLLSGWLRGRLASQNLLLEDALSERESLLRILGHDLSNALLAASAVVRVTRRRQERNGAAEVAEALADAETSLSHAHEIIDSTRMLLAVSSGKLPMPLAMHDLRPLAEEAAATFHQRARDKDVEIMLNLDPEPVMAGVEPAIFRTTLLGNLLSNAVKFSRPGEQVQVSVQADGDRILTRVGNVGPCIPAERKVELFSPCKPTTTPGTRGEKGTGFGLPLVQRLAERMQGRVEVASVPLDSDDQDQDLCRTTFSIVLPADPKLPLAACPIISEEAS